MAEEEKREQESCCAPSLLHQLWAGRISRATLSLPQRLHWRKGNRSCSHFQSSSGRMMSVQGLHQSSYKNVVKKKGFAETLHICHEIPTNSSWFCEVFCGNSHSHCLSTDRCLSNPVTRAMQGIVTILVITVSLHKQNVSWNAFNTPAAEDQ